jgi:eukaryotic-like serine/threonine-protein kinase
MQVVSQVTAVKLHEIGSGQGQNSKVFLADDPQLGGQIALKEVPLSRLTGNFFEEAQHLYRSRHPRVVPIMYASQDTHNAYIAMPYFPQGSLQGWLDSNGVPTVRQIIKWSQELLQGLHHIHSLGLVHFDIKPTNIFIANDGSAMVADFGQAKPVDAFGVAVQNRIYDRHWPPEVLLQGGATKQADIYQVGLTLYRLCNGNDLFYGQLPADRVTLARQIVAGLFPNRQQFLPHIPKRLRRVIVKALQVDPADRYQTALEMMDALGQIDTLLDWRHGATATGEQWVRDTLTHKYSIELVHTSSGSFQVTGHVVNLQTQRGQKRSVWCGGPFRTYVQAQRYLEKMFRREELG